MPVMTQAKRDITVLQVGVGRGADKTHNVKLGFVSKAQLKPRSVEEELVTSLY
jgi:hypothetical protein